MITYQLHATYKCQRASTTATAHLVLLRVRVSTWVAVTPQNDAQATGLNGSFFTPNAIDANQKRPSDESIPSTPPCREKMWRKLHVFVRKVELRCNAKSKRHGQHFPKLVEK